MAHWIIEDHGFGGQTYICSNCRNAWNDLYHYDILKDNCPECGEDIDEDANEYIEEIKKTGIIGKWEGMLIGNCFNCLHAEDGSKIGKDGWLNCPKWGAANIDPYGFCHMWEQKEQ